MCSTLPVSGKHRGCRQTLPVDTMCPAPESTNPYAEFLIIFRLRGHYLPVQTKSSVVPHADGEEAAHRLRTEIAAFLNSCHEPALLQPGDEVYPLQPGDYSLEVDAEGLLLECWADNRTLRRRLRGIRKQGQGRLEIDAERFPRKRCTLSLLDLQAAAASRVRTESWRGLACEALRGWCERLQPGWQVESLSAAPDLQRSLSPRFPRALLRLGSQGICAMAAPDGPAAEDVFTFGLVWLQHCRQRLGHLRVHTLMLFVPEVTASTVALRLTALNPERAQCRLVSVAADGVLRELLPRTWGNLEAQLTVPRLAPVDERLRQLFAEVARHGPAECVEDLRGGLFLELNGLPLARAEGRELWAGLKLRKRRVWPSAASLLRLAYRVARFRQAAPANPQHALYRLYPERWLESAVRRHIRVIDPTIRPETVRRQVTGALGAHTHRTDLLALDETGRLVILEVKADEDMHVVAQALDYCIRLKLQLQRGEAGPILGVAASRSNLPPRVLLVAPALSFHPANETVLAFLQSSMQVRQVGLALEWRRQLRPVFQRDA